MYERINVAAAVATPDYSRTLHHLEALEVLERVYENTQGKAALGEQTLRLGYRSERASDGAGGELKK